MNQNYLKNQKHKLKKSLNISNLKRFNNMPLWCNKVKLYKSLKKKKWSSSQLLKFLMFSKSIKLSKNTLHRIMNPYHKQNINHKSKLLLKNKARNNQQRFNTPIFKSKSIDCLRKWTLTVIKWLSQRSSSKSVTGSWNNLILIFLMKVKSSFKSILCN